ncbi:hypothetical protein [Nocardia sp. NPDC052112]|uniref:hypothetical protein n=1 Tax=Nocardia sp. NPDC052112 TaxID=3155646 RepID=UPI0034246E8D
MAGWQEFAIDLIAVLAGMATVVAVVLLWPSGVPEGQSVKETRQRVEQEDDEMDYAPALR